MKKLPLLLFAFAPTLIAADIAGSWVFNFVSFGEEVAPARVELKVEGDKLTGNLNEIKIEGTVQDSSLKFTATRPNGSQFGTFEGRVNGNEMTGTVRIGDEDRQWIARRVTLPTASPPTPSTPAISATPSMMTSSAVSGNSTAKMDSRCSPNHRTASRTSASNFNPCSGASRSPRPTSKRFVPAGSARGAGTWTTTGYGKARHSIFPCTRRAPCCLSAMATPRKATAS